MFENFKFSRKLAKLEKERAKAAKLYFALRERPSFDHDKHGLELSGHRFEVDMAEAEIESLMTDFWQGAARRLKIPIPELESDETLWKEPNHYNGARHLTTKGHAFVRQKVREEEKERREHLSFYASMLISILSLVVAILALWLGK